MQGHNSSLIVIVDDSLRKSDKHPSAFLIKCHPISAYSKAFALVHTHAQLFCSLQFLVLLTTYSNLLRFPIKGVQSSTILFADVTQLD